MSTARPRSLVGSLAREPLVHFALLGAALFGLERLASPAREVPRLSAPTRVSLATLRTELSEGFQRTRGRPPTDAEREELVSRWLDDEALYREGLSRGLDRDDPQVRQRIASKMDFVLQSRVLPPSPSEAALRDFFQRHQGRYARGEQIDFTQVFVQGADDAARARATELLGLLRSGADPAGLGDRFSGGRRYRQRQLTDLAETFGGDFASGLGAQPPGTWALRPSRYGLHLVRVDQRTPALTPDFDAVRLEVRRDWEQDHRARARAVALSALRRRWRVDLEGR